MNPSKYQQAVFDEIESGNGNLIVEALAGSGKTTTILHGQRKMKGSTCLTSFIKAIVTELAKKAVPGTALTIHALGLKAITQAIGKKPEVQPKKVHSIIQNLTAPLLHWGMDMRTTLENVCEKVKLKMVDPSKPDDMKLAADEYDLLDGYDDKEVATILDMVSPVLDECKRDPTVIDFDDMVWLPHVLGLRMPKFDWVCVDEAQDLNAAQRELVAKTVDGRVIFVGDSNQAVYGFAGAEIDSLDKIGSRFNAKRLPLSICYRCPASHVRLAQRIVPALEARPNAPEGVVEHYNEEWNIAGMMSDGDLVLCRINAPLAGIAMDLVRSGKKPVIYKGYDTSKVLLRLVEKRCGSGNLTPALVRLKMYGQREIEKYEKLDQQDKAEKLRDQIETIIVVSDGCGTVNGLANRIKTIFQSKGSGVLLSTIHRGKGLESDRVFLYRPDLLPFPKATKAWELQQERNLEYIACTRAKQALFIVHDREKEKWAEKKKEWL